MKHQLRPRIVSISWSFLEYRPFRYYLYNIDYTVYIQSCLSFCLCLALFIFTPSLVLWWAPGSRGRWGTVRPAGERRDCGRGGIRGHGHAAVWSQYCNSPAERQEGQVATVHCTLMLLPSCLLVRDRTILSLNWIEGRTGLFSYWF